MGSSNGGQRSFKTSGSTKRPAGSGGTEQESTRTLGSVYVRGRASRDFEQLGGAFRDLRQWGGVCRDFRQQEGSAKALAVGGGSAPEQTRTPYLHPAILPRSQEKQMEAQ